MGQTRPKIALLHHAGGGNLGDDASLRAVICSVQERWPDAEFSAFTMNPEESARRHGIPCYPLRKYRWGTGYMSEGGGKRAGGWFASTKNPLIRIPRVLLQEFLFYVHSFRRLRQFDLLLLSGGGQLTGRSGPWSFPYGLWVWLNLARLAGVRSVLLNLGAGPLRDRLSRFFAVRALNAADYVSFRDEPSEALLRSIGYRGRSEVYPDNVYNFAAAAPAAEEDERPGPIVGIAPMPYPQCEPRDFAPGELQPMYEEYIGKVAAFCASLVHSDCTIEIFGTDMGADPAVIEDLRRILREKHGIQTPPYLPVSSTDDLAARMSRMDYVLTCRYHGVVFANLLNKPVFALPHHRKVSDLMSSLGLAEYCVDIRGFQPEQLADTFIALVQHTAEVKATLASKLSAYRTKLDEQYDRLFPPRAGARPRSEERDAREERSELLTGTHRG